MKASTGKVSFLSTVQWASRIIISAEDATMRHLRSMQAVQASNTQQGGYSQVKEYSSTHT